MLLLPTNIYGQTRSPLLVATGLFVLAFSSLILALALAFVSIANADDGHGPVRDDAVFALGDVGGYLYSEMTATNRVYVERRFTDPRGHGFAAEEVNNFTDRLKGFDARVEGYNNEANGPDRRIVNRDGTSTWIQDKYYNSAKGSVDAAFDSETGQYRYLKDGKPMQLEVPADQHEEAVKLMKERIESGRVPGVSDPAEAENLVRKGSLTYKQAVNISKAGTIPSLKYDAARSVVSSTCVFGISYGIDFILCLNAGLSPQEAAGEAASNAVLTGGATFASEFITSQLMKTGSAELLAPSTDAVARWMGKDACEALVAASKSGAVNLSGKELAAQASRILSSKAVFTGVFTAVLTVPDAIDLVYGRISKGQFVKNLAVVVAAIAAGEAGGAIGTIVLKVPILGTAAGKVIGSLLGAGAGYLAADVIADQVFKDDADAMYEIVADRFAYYCEEYVVGVSDGEKLADSLNERLDDETLKDMFAAEDREAYVDGIVEPLFEELAQSRTYEEVPNDYVIRIAMLERLQGIVFLH